MNCTINLGGTTTCEGGIISYTITIKDKDGDVYYSDTVFPGSPVDIPGFTGTYPQLTAIDTKEKLVIEYIANTNCGSSEPVYKTIEPTNTDPCGTCPEGTYCVELNGEYKCEVEDPCNDVQCVKINYEIKIEDKTNILVFDSLLFNYPVEEFELQLCTEQGIVATITESTEIKLQPSTCYEIKVVKIVLSNECCLFEDICDIGKIQTADVEDPENPKCPDITVVCEDKPLSPEIELTCKPQTPTLTIDCI